MTIQDTNINLYETCGEILTAPPYAVISSEEMAAVIRRFTVYATMIAGHPKIARDFGDLSTAPIKLATDLRGAIKNSIKEAQYPNVVFPAEKFEAAMTLWKASQTLTPEIEELLENERKRWEE